MVAPSNSYTVLAAAVDWQLGLILSESQIAGLKTQIDCCKDLAERAEAHGVAPLFYDFVNFYNIELNAVQRRQFQALSLRHKKASQARAKVLVEVVENFAKNDIQFVLLKGIALVNSIYSKPEYRPMRDIDILVSASQLMKAKIIAEQIGFTFEKCHPSVFMGDMHHLPNAQRMESGFTISLELHHEIYSRDMKGSQKLEDVIDFARLIKLVENQTAHTLDHFAMLNHICQHSFSPGAEVRLSHQLDIVKYLQHYASEIDWQEICASHAFVFNTIRCLHYSLTLPEVISSKINKPNVPEIRGVGESMLAYTQILATKKTLTDRLQALFYPSPWWMHVNYNVEPGDSLLKSYLFSHPLAVTKGLALRLLQAFKNKIGHIINGH